MVRGESNFKLFSVFYTSVNLHIQRIPVGTFVTLIDDSIQAKNACFSDLGSEFGDGPFFSILGIYMLCVNRQMYFFGRSRPYYVYQSNKIHIRIVIVVVVVVVVVQVELIDASDWRAV